MRLIDADKLLDTMLGDNVFEPNADFDENTRRKVWEYIKNAPTALEMKPVFEDLERASSEFCEVRFLSLAQARQVIWGWFNGKTE